MDQHNKQTTSQSQHHLHYTSRGWKHATTTGCQGWGKGHRWGETAIGRISGPGGRAKGEGKRQEFPKCQKWFCFMGHDLIRFTIVTASFTTVHSSLGIFLVAKAWWWMIRCFQTAARMIACTCFTRLLALVPTICLDENKGHSRAVVPAALNI